MTAPISSAKRGSTSAILSTLQCRRQPRGNYITKCSSSTLTGSIQVRSGLQCVPSNRDLSTSIAEGRTTIMRAMRAEGFSGYKELKLVDIPKPALSDGRVLVRIRAAGVTPLDHTILAGETHVRKRRWS